jgi:hypothetical protein
MLKEIRLVHDRACFSRVCVVDLAPIGCCGGCLFAIVEMSVCWCTNTVKSQIANRRQWKKNSNA